MPFSQTSEIGVSPSEGRVAQASGGGVENSSQEVAITTDTIQQQVTPLQMPPSSEGRVAQASGGAVGNSSQEVAITTDTIQQQCPHHLKVE